MSTEQYRRTLQLTSEGIDRYHKLSELDTIPPQLAGEWKALQILIHQHPLDYVIKPAGKAPPNFEALVQKGYAEEVGDRYGHMMSLLTRHDPGLVPAFQAYKRLAYEEETSEEELDKALRILRARALAEKAHIIKGWEEIDKEYEEHVPHPEGALEPLDRLAKISRTQGSRSDKAIALDNAMHQLHWDPDLLRTLPKKEQSLVGGSIQSWLRQLAGDPQEDWVEEWE